MKTRRYPEFERALRQIRKQAGVTQEQMAREMGITTSAIQKWERGANTPEFSMLGKIMGYFGEDGWLVLHSMGMTVDEIRQLCVGFIKADRGARSKSNPKRDEA